MTKPADPYDLDLLECIARLAEENLGTDEPPSFDRGYAEALDGVLYSLDIGGRTADKLRLALRCFYDSSGAGADALAEVSQMIDAGVHRGGGAFSVVREEKEDGED